jgi:hypothetical protein
MDHIYLSEAFVIKDHDVKEIIQEINGRERRVLQLEGRFGMMEEINRNKRIYPRPVLEREVKKVTKDKIHGEGILIGELEHPVVSKDEANAMGRVQRIAYERAAIGIKDLRISGNEILGRCEILEDANDCGRSVASIVRAGGKPGISSRGFGSSPSANSRGELVVAEDYNLVTFDIVSDPSTYGARLNAFLNEEYERAINLKKDHSKTLWNVLSDIRKKYE